MPVLTDPRAVSRLQRTILMRLAMASDALTTAASEYKRIGGLDANPDPALPRLHEFDNIANLTDTLEAKVARHFGKAVS